ncbi:unnamed protein product, partial [Pylaiella littoralis]
GWGQQRGQSSAQRHSQGGSSSSPSASWEKSSSLDASARGGRVGVGPGGGEKDKRGARAPLPWHPGPRTSGAGPPPPVSSTAGVAIAASIGRRQQQQRGGGLTSAVRQKG